MKLLMTVSNTHLLIQPENSAAFLQSLSGITPVHKTGWGSDAKYVPAPDVEIEISVLNESKLEPTPDPIQKLQEEKKLADSRWIEYYNKANAFEKELKELKENLQKRGIEIKPTPDATV